MTTGIADPTSRRLREVSESVTLAITAKAKALRAQGEDVIGFGAGEPDFPTPGHIVTAAQAACVEPANHRYSPAAGLPRLRTAIAAKTVRDSGLQVEDEEVLVANGGKHALYNAFQALVDPGDEVLLPAPYWVSYPEQIRLAGGTAVELPTDAVSGFRVSVEQLEAARTARTKVLVFVSPSNPTGVVYPPEEIEAIGRWAADAGVWVVTDEIYEHLVYGDARHVSLPVVAPEARERCVVVNGVAKTYAMTGWRVGWSIAPVAVTNAMARLQSHATSNVAGVTQAAALAALEGSLDDVAEMRATYDRRRRLTHDRLTAIDGVTCPLPEGAFYAFPSFEAFLGRRIGGRQVHTSLELCEALLEVARIALVPGEGFGAPGYARLSYALGDDDLVRGLDRLADALG
ncbi:MAG TPA: pyridoxal phosphate-dependent aminotransferase [Egibacteraceae bacterium]|nr:pyridoxal phosphate-dependent aminotransferase [Egibacteraceae bacterium]